MAAPILSLAEGNAPSPCSLISRAVVATPVIDQSIGYALDVTLTGAKGWLAADSVQASLLTDDGYGEARAFAYGDARRGRGCGGRVRSGAARAGPALGARSCAV